MTIANLPEYRKQLRNNLHRAKGDSHDHLNVLVLEFMKRHVAENYHPAVRVNAMLMIGELTVSSRSAARRPFRCPRR